MDKYYKNTHENYHTTHLTSINIHKVNQTTQTKQLPDVFKELKEIQKRQVLERLNESESSHSQNVHKKGKNRLKGKGQKRLQNDINLANQNYGKKVMHTHKFNEMGIIIGILFLILFITTIKSNYIFANSKEAEKEVIGEFEVNENAMNIMEMISENISEVTRKDIVTEKITIPYETTYIDNDMLPKGEEVIDQEGINGSKEITYIRTYENNSLIEEKNINENVLQEPVEAIIERGTSEFLFQYQVHIGDTMYTMEEIPMMAEPNDEAMRICNIYDTIDVTLLSEKDGWCKVHVDDLEGYVHTDFLTSEFINPEMVEKSRIKRIMLTLDFDMEINKPSGLTRSDFTKVLSGNENDVNQIFERNAGLFYDIEQKYNINGIFLASIGIHESNWGRSNISKDKKNLFGYGAYDSSPYASSYTFESYEYGIELLAKVLTKYYINTPETEIYDGELALGTYYNGPTISGVNTRYASDPNWANRVFSIMTQLYEKLQEPEI